jgi:hypothetical protein
MECIHSRWLLFSRTNHKGQHLLPAKGDIIREAANSRQSSSVKLAHCGGESAFSLGENK